VLFGEREALAFIECNNENTGFRRYDGGLREGFRSGWDKTVRSWEKASNRRTAFSPIALSFVGVADPEMPPGLLLSLSVMVDVEGDREKVLVSGPRWVSFNSARNTSQLNSPSREQKSKRAAKSLLLRGSKGICHPKESALDWEALGVGYGGESWQRTLGQFPRHLGWITAAFAIIGTEVPIESR